MPDRKLKTKSLFCLFSVFDETNEENVEDFLDFFTSWGQFFVIEAYAGGSLAVQVISFKSQVQLKSQSQLGMGFISKCSNFA